jgi:hypothetical protein
MSKKCSTFAPKYVVLGKKTKDINLNNYTNEKDYYNYWHGISYANDRNANLCATTG